MGLVSVVLASALLVAPADAASPEPTGSASGDDTGMLPPAEIESVDPVGAAAAMLFWFTALNHGNLTGEVLPFVRVSEYTCGQCALVVDEIEKRHDADLQQEGGLVSIDSVVYRGSPQEDLWVFDVVTSREAGTRTAPDGSVEELPFERGPVEVQVVWQQADLKGSRRLTVRSVLPIDQAGFDR